MRPLPGLRHALDRVPRRIRAAVRHQLDERRRQYGDHGHRRHVLPANEPIQAGPRTGHQFDVVREALNAVHVADGQALKQRDDQQRKVTGEAVHQLEHVAAGAVREARRYGAARQA